MPIALPKIVRQKKRVGRGIGSRGAKSGRGQKGQKSRAGYSSKAGFEGGQTPLYMRLPKGRGSKQRPASQVIKPVIISIKHLRSFTDGSIVGPGQMRKAGLVAGRSDRVKLVGEQAIDKKLIVRVHAATASATQAVEKSGGKVEIITGSK